MFVWILFCFGLLLLDVFVLNLLFSDVGFCVVLLNFVSKFGIVLFMVKFIRFVV